MNRQVARAHWAARAEGFAIEEVTVGDLLRRAAHQSPDRIGFVAGTADRSRRERVPYRELLARVEAAGRALAARFAPGDRVGVWAANSPQWTVLELASALAGTVLVPINPAFRRAEAAYVLRHSGAVGVVFDREVRSNPIGVLLDELRPELPTVRELIDFAGWDSFAQSAPGQALPVVAADAPLLMQYTSGTTGAPKGALLHHRGLVNKCRIAVTLMDLGPHPVWLNFMPLFHIGGCGLSTVGPLAVQGTQVQVERFDPSLVLELVESERATFLGGVPTMLLSLMEHPDFATRDLSSLRSVLSGGAAVAPDLVRQIERALGVRFMVAFGQTEGHGHICQTRPTDRAEDKAETVGQALPYVELRLTDPRDGGVVALDEVGELCARSPFVMLRYHNMPEQTAAAIDADGFLHTGDLCTMDDRGYVRFVGRLKEMIVRGGENIYPREIEDVLFEHPAIADVAIVGVPDAHYGEEVAAFIRLHHEVTIDELREYTRARLAPFKCPRYWKIIDEFPLTGSGKVQKFALVEQFTAG